MKIFLALLIVLVFYNSLDAASIIPESDDQIYFPTEDVLAYRTAEECEYNK